MYKQSFSFLPITHTSHRGPFLTSLASSGSPWLRAEYRIMYCVAPGAAPQLTRSVLKEEGLASKLAGIARGTDERDGGGKGKERSRREEMFCNF